MYLLYKMYMYVHFANGILYLCDIYVWVFTPVPTAISSPLFIRLTPCPTAGNAAHTKAAGQQDRKKRRLEGKFVAFKTP